MNSFAAHIAPICGCATSMRRTLNAPTITFSTQKSSRVENTLQPKNRTPARGTRFAATSTRALGESRKARRSGTGVFKVFFDLLPQDSLIGKIGVPLVTGHGLAHALSIDHGLRPLFASLGATVIAGGVYATSQQFTDGKPGRELLEAVDRAVAEALALATAGLSGPGPRGT